MSEDRAPLRPTIRNAVVHMTGDQPIVVDLFEMPSRADVVLVCTNVRTLDGKRPVWADQVGSTFLFPFQVIRFVEIHSDVDTKRALDAGPAQAAPEEPEADLEIDEDFLRRIREV